MSPETLKIIVVWMGALATLGIFSFLWRENPVYRFFEHLFMGITLGWNIVKAWTNVLVPKWLTPIANSTSPEGSYYDLLWLLAFPVGMMWYFIFSRKLKWIARIIIGFFIGVGAGMGIMGFFRLYLPQITASFKSLWPDPDGKRSALAVARDNAVFLVTFYASMVYFIFTFKRDSGVVKHIATSGRWLMMVAFGAMFGATVMGRLSLFIERMQFLLIDWLGIAG